MKAHHWCDFEWDERGLPGSGRHAPAAQGNGATHLRVDQPLHRRTLRAVRRGSGERLPAQAAERRRVPAAQWQAGMGYVDFTNPDATRWYQEELRRLVRMGVDCFKTDFGEEIPTDVAYFDGSDPELMHNYYTYLYNQAVFGLLEEERGPNEAVVFARSATASLPEVPGPLGRRLLRHLRIDGREPARRALAHPVRLRVLEPRHRRLRDQSLRRACTSDGWPSACCRRTAACTAARSYRVPWVYDEEAVDVLRYFTQLKCRLMPYLMRAAVEATPERRADDARRCCWSSRTIPTCRTLDRQYMLGDCLLVAPVFHDARGGVLLAGGRVDAPSDRRGAAGRPLVRRSAGLLRPAALRSARMR